MTGGGELHGLAAGRGAEVEDARRRRRDQPRGERGGEVLHPPAALAEARQARRTDAVGESAMARGELRRHRAKAAASSSLAKLRSSGGRGGRWRGARRRPRLRPTPRPALLDRGRAAAALVGAWARPCAAGCRARRGPAAAARRRPAARRSRRAHGRACRGRSSAPARGAAPSAPWRRRGAAGGSRCRSARRGRAGGGSVSPAIASASAASAGGSPREACAALSSVWPRRSTASSILSAARRAAKAVRRLAWRSLRPICARHETPRHLEAPGLSDAIAAGARAASGRAAAPPAGEEAARPDPLRRLGEEGHRGRFLDRSASARGGRLISASSTSSTARVAGEQGIDRSDDRHVDAALARQPGEHRRGERAFGHGAAVGHQLGGIAAFADPLAEREIAARGRRAGQDQVAEAATARPAFRAARPARGRSGSFRQSRARSAPRAHSGRARALDHAAGDGEHVLDRSADFRAGDVVAEIDAEGGQRDAGRAAVRRAPASSHASVTAVGRPAATSCAKVGPDSTATGEVGQTSRATS